MSQLKWIQNVPFASKDLRHLRLWTAFIRFVKIAYHRCYASQKNKEEVVDLFACPVCHCVTSAPDSGQTPEEWAARLQTSMTVLQACKPHLQDKNYCQPCKFNGKKEPSSAFCSTCSEYLCKLCCNYHNRFKVSIDHDIIDNAATEKNGGDADVRSFCRCSLHNKMLKYYCQTHRYLCRSKCVIEHHRECQNLECIDNLCEAFQQDKSFCELEDKLKVLTNNFTMFLKHGEENMQNVRQQSDAIRKSVHTRVQEILDEVEILEASVLNRSPQYFREKITKPSEHLEKCNKVSAAIDTSRLIFDEASGKENSTFYFIILLRLFEHVKGYIVSLMTLKAAMNKVVFNFVPSEKVFHLLQGETLGKISRKSTNISLPLESVDSVYFTTVVDNGGAHYRMQNRGYQTGRRRAISSSNMTTLVVKMSKALLCHKTMTKCPMCLQSLTSPKVLHCMHIFCELCVSSSMSKERRGDEFMGMFTFPLCQYITSSQLYDETPELWASNLPDFSVVVSQDKKSVALDEIYCHPCQLDGKSENPTAQCNTCSEYLCETCVQYHKRFKISMNHAGTSLIPKNGVNEDPAVEYLSRCMIHGKRFKYYCQSHQYLCCSKCVIVQHRGCPGLECIEHILENYLKGDWSIVLQKQLNTLAENYKSIRYHEKDSIQLIRTQSEDMKRSLNVWNEKMVQKVKDLQQLVLDSLEANQKNTESEISERLKECKSAIVALETSTFMVQAIRSTADKTQGFILFKKLSQQVDSYVSKQDSIYAKLCEFKLQFVPNEKMNIL
ncbi:hypothetical protein CHS0354_038338 [Potamilus streckersoni]|uniref:Uncharacterized protein n=1 Tax=Potamilus streckersoni TaxID=2493646 RepID=A0AAE0S610_9BIVA|nr:hypothetical protein CHS0354_038338 [Potamilus streckersoni]